MTAGRLQGKVVFITGAARGMGRSHAIRLAEEGADIIGMDVCGPVPGMRAPLASAADLAETVAAVEAQDRRMVSFTADVTDEDALVAGLADGVAQLGRLDCAVANAGISGVSNPVAEMPVQDWRDVIETNLTGVFITAKAAVPHIQAHGGGGSILLISSALGLRGKQNVAGYTASKHALVGLMRAMAIELAPDAIRVNTIHPTNVATPLVLNDYTFGRFRPELEHPTEDDVRPLFQDLNLLEIPWIQPSDISEAVLYLAAESGRYITGSLHKVDAGWITK